MLQRKTINNQIIVEIKPEEYKRLRGLSLDTTFNQGKKSVTAGIVVSVPDEIRYHPERPQEITWKTSLEVEIGDEVIFHYLCFYNATISDGDISGKLFTENGKTYLYVSYSQVFLAIRNDKIIMTNGYILAEKVLKKHKISVPHKFRDLKNVFKVYHNGSNNKTYLHPGYSDADVSVGDTILTEKSCDIPLQYPYFSLLDKNYVRIQKNNILALL